MKPLLRMGACALVGILTLMFTGGVLLPALGAPSLAPHDVGSAFSLLWIEQMRSEELTVRDQALWRSLDAKQEAVRELIAERMTLLEAAERFGQANSRLADDQGESISSCKTIAGEWLCKNVIQWVSRYLDAQPEERGRVVARLERELEQLRLSREAL